MHKQMIEAQANECRARQVERESFIPSLRKLARHEARRAEDQFITARLALWADVLNTQQIEVRQ